MPTDTDQETFSNVQPIDEPETFSNVTKIEPSTYQKLTAPIDSEAHNPVSRFFSSVGGAVIGAPEGLYNTLRHPGDTLAGISDSVGAWMDPKTRPTWEGIKSVLPEALGGGVGTVAAGEALGAAVPKIVKAGGVAREAIGGAIHDEGQLTPGVEAASKATGGAVGAVAGHAIGGPIGAEVGGVAGYTLGPALLDKIFPEPKNLAEARAQAEAYQAKAEDLMRRGREQDALDRRAARTQAAQDEADAEARKAVPISQSPNYPQLLAAKRAAMKPPEPSPIVEPNSPAPKINTTYVSYPRPLLVKMANMGNVDALKELVRNPGGVDVQSAVPNARYLMELDAPRQTYGGVSLAQ
jgi:hypothetical protein